MKIDFGRRPFRGRVTRLLNAATVCRRKFRALSNLIAVLIFIMLDEIVNFFGIGSLIFCKFVLEKILGNLTKNPP